MIKSSIMKRLDVLEESVVSDVYILVFQGAPPIYVQITTGRGTNRVNELKLFDSEEEVEQFLDAHYPGVKAIGLVSGNLTSAELHECCL